MSFEICEELKLVRWSGLILRFLGMNNFVICILWFIDFDILYLGH